jgi:hypothetical protein
MVAAGKFAQRRTLLAAFTGFDPLSRGQLRRPTHVLTACCGANPSLRRTGSDQIAFHIREPAENGNHQAAGARGGIGPRFSQRPELRPGVDDTFDDREQVEGAPSKSINPGDDDYIPGDEVLEELQEFASVSPRTAGRFAVDLIAPTCAKLFKLGVEGLPKGADAGVSQVTIFCVNFDHILRKL